MMQITVTSGNFRRICFHIATDEESGKNLSAKATQMNISLVRMRYEPNAEAVRKVVRPTYPMIMTGVYSPAFLNSTANQWRIESL